MSDIPTSDIAVSDIASKSRDDFSRAKFLGKVRRLWSNLTGREDRLIPFEELKKNIGLVSQHYSGLQVVPMDKIIGSFGRSRDFDRVFLPMQSHSRGKWVSVNRAMREGVVLPPISLYKVGDAYFVVDGHHRISVARQRGQTFIDAEVIELQSRVPVTADLRLEDLDGLAAYRDFLEQTHLDTLRPGADLRVTMPGDYIKLLDHIRVHKYFMDRERSRSMTSEEAITHWYDTVYLPLVQAIRAHELMRDFPGHTEADLYLWMIEHAYYLMQKLGQQLTPWEVARDYVNRFGRRPERLVNRVKRAILDLLIPDQLAAGPPAGAWREERVEDSPTPHLFRDILVTVTGAESGWRALGQAAEFARREGSVLHGLHIVTEDSEEAVGCGQRILEEFTFRCGGLGAKSTTNLVVGDIAEQIVERARWVDMVVINQRREHGRWAQRPLGTIFQTVAARAARPVLAVPGTAMTPLRRVVLAYDGSPKAREALFVFKHLVVCWAVEGVLVTVESSRTGQETLDMALRYIQESSGPKVAAHLVGGQAHEAILHTMEQERADLLLLGGYGYQPLLKAFLGSTVDQVLREAWFPVLICR